MIVNGSHEAKHGQVRVGTSVTQRTLDEFTCEPRITSKTQQLPPGLGSAPFCWTLSSGAMWVTWDPRLVFVAHAWGEKPVGGETASPEDLWGCLGSGLV